MDNILNVYNFGRFFFEANQLDQSVGMSIVDEIGNAPEREENSICVLICINFNSCELPSTLKETTVIARCLHSWYMNFHHFKTISSQNLLSVPKQAGQMKECLPLMAEQCTQRYI